MQDVIDLLGQSVSANFVVSSEQASYNFVGLYVVDDLDGGIDQRRRILIY
jgi:hypothetical protein